MSALPPSVYCYPPLRVRCTALTFYILHTHIMHPPLYLMTSPQVTVEIFIGLLLLIHNCWCECLLPRHHRSNTQFLLHQGLLQILDLVDIHPRHIRPVDTNCRDNQSPLLLSFIPRQLWRMCIVYCSSDMNAYHHLCYYVCQSGPVAVMHHYPIEVVLVHYIKNGGGDNFIWTH